MASFSRSVDQPPNAPAANVPNFVRAGGELLEAFEQLWSYQYYVHRTGDEGVVDSSIVDKMLLDFSEVHSYMRDGYRGLDDAPECESRVQKLKEKVVCYLLGRASTSTVLRVETSDSIWLEPLCSGFHDGTSANSKVRTLDICLMNRRDSLQGIASLLEGNSSVKCLRISSSSAVEKGGHYVAQALRTNKLEKLDIQGLSFCDDRIAGKTANKKSNTQLIAEALVEQKSLNSLSVSAVAPFLKSLAWEESRSHCTVENLTLLFPKHEAATSLDLRDVLATNRALRTVKLVNADFDHEGWLLLLGSLRMNTNLQVLDIGGGIGRMTQVVLDGLLNQIRTQCALDQKMQREKDDSLLAFKEQLRLNQEYYGQVRKSLSFRDLRPYHDGVRKSVSFGDLQHASAGTASVC